MLSQITTIRRSSTFKQRRRDTEVYIALFRLMRRINKYSVNLSSFTSLPRCAALVGRVTNYQIGFVNIC